jgi:hypothetical protein
MKLKLLLASIIIFFVLIFVALQTYRNTQSLEYISSYADCIADQASTIEDAFPETCVSRFGSRFINPDSVPENRPGSTQLLHDASQKVSSYQSSVAKLSFTFKEPLYVVDTYNVDSSNLGSGTIIISRSLVDNNNPPSIYITYGIPLIDGKGGACLSETGESAWVDKQILGTTVSVCETETGLSGGYPVHPSGKIEYFFGVGGENITRSEANFFKDILYSAEFTN